MSIRATLAKIYAIQAALAITQPTTMTIKRVWHYSPPASAAFADLPCFTNEVTFNTIDPTRMMSQREYSYTVLMTCAVARAAVEDDVSADIAAAFWDVAFEAFCADVGLGGEVTLALLRGGQPTIGFLQQGGQGYIGFTASLDIKVEEAYSW